MAYFPPGVFINERRVPGRGLVIAASRGLCIVGVGDTTQTVLNEIVVRGYINREQVTFNGATPNIASLAFISNQVVGVSKLESFNGVAFTEVPTNMWSFVNSTTVQISNSVFDSALNYFFSYQATDIDYDTLTDAPDLREIIRIGTLRGISSFSSETDYIHRTAISSVTQTVGTGPAPTIEASSYYANFEARTYTVKITTGGIVGTAKFDWFGNTANSGGQQNITTAATVALEDGLVLAFAPGTYVLNDEFTFGVSNLGGILWGSRTFEETESFSKTQVLQDFTGTKTGTIGNFYVRLQFVPTSLTSVETLPSGEDLLASPSDVAIVAGTKFVDLGSSNPFTTVPADSSLKVVYDHVGTKPAVGSTYFVSYKLEKDDSFYNVPRQTLSEEQLLSEVGAVTSSNQLAIAGQIAYQNGASQVWYVQIKDSDADGIYTPDDYLAGIVATETKVEITDVIPLSTHPEVRAELVVSTARASSLEVQHPRLGWFGAPTDTAIGDLSTENTLIYMSRNELSVTPDSSALGRLILVGNTFAKRRIALPSGQRVLLTLETPFINTALATVQNEFTTPADTLLRKPIVGFTEIQDYTDSQK